MKYIEPRTRRQFTTETILYKAQQAMTKNPWLIDGDISMMETEELEQIEDNNKKFLFA